MKVYYHQVMLTERAQLMFGCSNPFYVEHSIKTNLINIVNSNQNLALNIAHILEKETSNTLKIMEK